VGGLEAPADCDQRDRSADATSLRRLECLLVHLDMHAAHIHRQRLWEAQVSSGWDLGSADR